VGNFLVLIPPSETERKAADNFKSGLELAKSVKAQVSTKTVSTGWSHATVFLREDGSGAPVYTHPQTGGWLLASGVWFHANHFGSGEEGKLFDRYLEVGAEKLARELDGMFVIVIGDHGYQWQLPRVYCQC
jgi:hypothetical protein